MASKLIKTSVKFTRTQRRHLRSLAKRDRHGQISTAMKRLVDEDMARVAKQEVANDAH